MKLFNLIYDEYISLDFPKKFKNISNAQKLTWYLADELNGIISINKDIYEIDVKSAYPTLCKCICNLGDQYINKEFIKEMESIKDKIEKNIFISTTLKHTGYLQELGIISKMIVFGYLISNDPDCDILELKKDGIICTSEYQLHNHNNFLRLINELNIKFKTTKYDKYIRFNKTSTFIKDNSIERKGKYKYYPPFLKEIAYKIIHGDKYNTNDLLKYYSKKYLTIICNNSLDELLLKYYIADGKILTNKGNYENIISYIKLQTMIDPILYLKLLVYPLIISNK